MADNSFDGTTTSDHVVDDRSAAISAKLKQIYSKSILPVEKKYRYDYFFESPLLTDVEFDGALLFYFIFVILILLLVSVCAQC